MGAIPESRVTKKRKSRMPAGPTGARLVMAELVRRGFNARLADRATKDYDILIDLHGSPPKPIHVRAVHVGPWYVRSSQFAGAAANQVTVYVLFGFAKNLNSVRFFVTKNSDVEAGLRRPLNWPHFGFIDVEAVQEYEDNWDILVTPQA
jgi:hypothetical protein